MWGAARRSLQLLDRSPCAIVLARRDTCRARLRLLHPRSGRPFAPGQFGAVPSRGCHSAKVTSKPTAINGALDAPEFYFFFARRFLAVFSIAKSSNFFPSSIAATSHRGFAPRPAQMLPALSRYFGGTFLPFSELPRPLLDAISPPNLASWLRSITVLRLSSFPTSSRNCKSCSTDIEPRFRFRH